MDYKFCPASMPINRVQCVIRQSDGAAIPFDIANRDCFQFLADWQQGATVSNADDSPAPYSAAMARALGLI